MSESPRGDRFNTTHWSVVVSAGGSSSTDASRALATLCETYWFPLYAYVRRAGHSAADAQDLTQDFFVHLLAKNRLAIADRQRGRFRTFLLCSMKNFLINYEKMQDTQKRGGGRPTISFDINSATNRYGILEPVDNLTPDRIYEKRWALTVLDLVVRRLSEEFCAAGRLSLFEQLKPFLARGTTKASREAVARQLGMSEGAVKVAVHRMRQRCRQLFREEVARTTADPDAIDDELTEVLAALRAEK